MTHLSIFFILARHQPHHRCDRHARDRTLWRRRRGRRRRYDDRSILHGHRRDRARQFPHTLVPAQSRRGDWEILWTDGSGSRLVLLLLLRPLAPSISAHTVRGKRRGKRDASKWAAMRARRIEERRKRRMRMLELSTGCPPCIRGKGTRRGGNSRTHYLP